MKRIIEDYPHSQSIPFHCDICGIFDDTAGDGPRNAIFLCPSNHHFCSNHMYDVEGLHLSQLHEIINLMEPEWFEFHKNLPSTEFWMKFINFKLPKEQIKKRERKFLDTYYYPEDDNHFYELVEYMTVEWILYPICTMKFISTKNALDLLLLKEKKTKEILLQEFQKEFSNLEDFNREVRKFETNFDCTHQQDLDRSISNKGENKS